MGKRGRPEHVPDERSKAFVKALVVLGEPQEHICKVLDISRKTLRKHYREELTEGKLQTHAMVVANLLRHTRTNPAACMFYLKTQCGWRENGQAPVEEDAPAPVFRVTAKGERIKSEDGGDE